MNAIKILSKDKIKEKSQRRKKIELLHVTGRGGPYSCEMSRLPHFPVSWLTDGGKVVSLMRWAYLYPQEDSWYSFMLEAESTPGP
jgi:hypothetical protein